MHIEKRLKTRVQNDVLHIQKIQIYQIPRTLTLSVSKIKCIISGMLIIVH